MSKKRSPIIYIAFKQMKTLLSMSIILFRGGKRQSSSVQTKHKHSRSDKHAKLRYLFKNEFFNIHLETGKMQSRPVTRGGFKPLEKCVGHCLKKLLDIL